jgi:hypothetical protein
MRTLALIGTLLFIAGTFLVTRATGWNQYGYIISGTLAGLLGLLVLGLTASNSETDPDATPARKSRSKGRVRRRSTTGIRSLRVRRTPVGAAGGR